MFLFGADNGIYDKGISATQMERRCIATDREDMNREIRQKNNLLQQILNGLKQLKEFLKETLTQATFEKQDEPNDPMATSMRERLAWAKRQSNNRVLEQKRETSQDNMPAKRIRKDYLER